MPSDQEIPAYPFSAPVPGEPAPAFARLRGDRPVSLVTLPTGGEAWLVTRLADNRQVLSDPRFSRAAASTPDAPRLQPLPPHPAAMFSMDPPAHTRVRALVAGAFTPRRVQRLEPEVRRMTISLVDAMEAAGPPADLVSGIARPLPIAVVCALIGVPEQERARVWSLTETLLSIPSGDPGPVLSARRELTSYLGDLVARKSAQPQDDMLSALVSVHETTDRLTATELVLLGVTILAGGFHTTASEITLSCLALLRNPRQLAALRADPGLTPRAVEELLRYNALTSAGGGLIRVATEDVKVGDVVIKAGEAVVPAIVAANRDPDAFSAPDTLELSRADNAHVTFGYGPHFCLGAGLARLELTTALAVLLERFPGLQLAIDPAELVVTREHVVRGLDSLPVTW